MQVEHQAQLGGRGHPDLLAVFEDDLAVLGVAELRCQGLFGLEGGETRELDPGHRNAGVDAVGVAQVVGCQQRQ